MSISVRPPGKTRTKTGEANPCSFGEEHVIFSVLPFLLDHIAKEEADTLLLAESESFEAEYDNYGSDNDEDEEVDCDNMCSPEAMLRCRSVLEKDLRTREAEEGGFDVLKKLTESILGMRWGDLPPEDGDGCTALEDAGTM